MDHDGDGNTSCNWRAQYSHQRIGRGIGRLENKRTSGDDQNNSIAEISQNAKKNPSRDLRRLAVNQNLVENLQLTLS